MWKKIVMKAQEMIQIAEGLKGKTGPEKKALVVKWMCESVNIPLVPDWLEGLIEPPLYGFVVDVLVKWWNELTAHRLEDIPANAETAAVMADMVVAEVKATAGAPLPAGSYEKIDALIAKYGAKQ